MALCGVWAFTLRTLKKSEKDVKIMDGLLEPSPFSACQKPHQLHFIGTKMQPSNRCDNQELTGHWSVNYFSSILEAEGRSHMMKKSKTLISGFALSSHKQMSNTLLTFSSGEHNVHCPLLSGFWAQMEAFVTLHSQNALIFLVTGV